MILLMLLVACLPPDFNLTHIDDLQVVAVQVDPPALAPGLDVVVTTWVADPARRGADILLYTCTIIDEEGCVEGREVQGTGPHPLTAWSAVGQLVGNNWSVGFSLPTDDEQFLADLDIPGSSETLLYALACEPGACEIIDRVAADPPPGTEAYQNILDMFANPEPWVAELPRDVSSLAIKTVTLQQSESVSNTNPRVTPLSPGAVLAYRDDLDPIDLTFNVFDGGQANFDVRAYTTVGTIYGIDPKPTSVDFTWNPGTMVGEGEIFLVVADKNGGIGVKAKRVSVRPNEP